MRHIISVLFIAALFAHASARAQFPPPDAAPATPVDMVDLLPFEPTREEAVLEAYVDGVVAAHQREHGAPAVAVSVVRDGRILFAKAYGEADVQKGVAANGTDTLFRIGSVSKTFVWTAVMMLHERGLIDLDEDVNRYLKGLQIPEAFDAPVTMNDLMAHRAGFEDAFAVFTVGDNESLSLTEVLAEHMPARVYPPGGRTSYSNWGTALAAKIVEDVSGVPYTEFLQKEILDPLSLTHTALIAPSHMDEETRALLAKGYRLSYGKRYEAPYMELGPYAPAGAIVSSAGDMARWMLVHLGRGAHDGARLMRPETHDLMWTRGFDDRPDGADLAHGFMMRRYRGYETFSHDGATSFFLTSMTMVPELGVGIFVSQNSTGDHSLTSDLPWLVIDHVIGDAAAPAQDGEAATDFAATDYAGSYLTNRRSFTKFEKLFSVGGLATVAPAKGGLLVGMGGGKRFYAPAAPDVFENPQGERIVFARDEAGRVTHFTDASGANSFERTTLSTDASLINLALLMAAMFSMTIITGAWRRAGRGEASTNVGRILNAGALAAAVIVLIFASVFAWMFMELSIAGPEFLLSYPATPIVAVRWTALGVLFAGAAAVVGLWFVWRGSGWGLWHKLHYTAFALSLGYFALVLIQWNVVFAPTA